MQITSLIIGILVGFLSAHSVFEHSYTAILFWGSVGLAIGWFTPVAKIRNCGLAYGFFLMLSFLIFGFQGDKSRFVSFGLLSLVLSLVSALAGWVALLVGAKLKNYFKKS